MGANIPATPAEIALAAVTGAVVGDVVSDFADNVYQMAKQSKQSQKERATDIPSYAKNYERDPNESCHDFAVSLLKQQFGNNHPKVFQRGPGSDYSKIKKNCERDCK